MAEPIVREAVIAWRLKLGSEVSGARLLNAFEEENAGPKRQMAEAKMDVSTLLLMIEMKAGERCAFE